MTADYLYAGVHIEEDAILTIQDESGTSGSLTATGGEGIEDSALISFAPGAGIGGNGAHVISDSDVGNSNMGTLYITGGTIKATGGEALNGGGNVGSAAGIGAGGVVDFGGDYEDTGIQYGNVNISGGTVIATGGGEISIKAGGAGIGTGGTQSYTGNNGMVIKISGGYVEAYGNNGGAGIGGGAHIGGCQIEITGGEVIAVGKNTISNSLDDDCNPAGIGGGSLGNSTSEIEEEFTEIIITGDAKVTATGANTGAGIGSGGSGYKKGSYDITIGGTAVVEAIGGSYDTYIGGAGIGCAYMGYADGVITIKDEAVVTATGGGGAAGIGGAGAIETGTVNAVDIIIQDDAVVTATGGAGAAGIGSGYDSVNYSGGMQVYQGDITIENNAKVLAIGGDYGAGIGGGWISSFLSTSCISIKDSANVTALGGKYAAGIGLGYEDGWVTGTYTFCLGTVSITASDEGAPTVVAVAGEGAQAIGFGYTKERDPVAPGNNSFEIGEGVSDVWLFNRSDTTTALLGIYAANSSYLSGLADTIDPVIKGFDYLNDWDITYTSNGYPLSDMGGKYSSEQPVVIWDNTCNDNFQDGGDAQWDTELALGTGGYSWTNEGDIITIYQNDTYLRSFNLNTLVSMDSNNSTKEEVIRDIDISDYNLSTATLSNWATFDIENPYTVSYDLNGGTGDTIPEPTDYYPGTEVTVTGEEATREGYVFVGWVSDYDNLTYEGDGTETFDMPYQDVILIAQWEKVTTEIEEDPEDTKEETGVSEEVPDTSDNTNTMMWIIISMISVIMGAILLKKEYVK